MATFSLDGTFPTWQLPAMSKLRTFRKSLDLTQAELAQKVGVTKPTISKLETGKGRPSVALIERLISVSRGKLTANDLVSVRRSS